MDTSKQVVFIWALPVLTVLAIFAIIIRFVSIKKHHPSSKDTTSNLQLTDSYDSPSSSSPPSWDVFLNFYGKETRRNFIANLYFSLDQAEILTFKDDPELEKGEEISCGLLKAIDGSKMFVVVLSENYAWSPWCLNELVEILNRKRKYNRVVPVFYYVDPSDLRHQRGSFGEALAYHMKRYSVDIIEKWKSALAEIGQLSGYHLKKDADENESNIIQEIVENVLQTTCTKELHLDEYLVGINPVVEEIYQKLSMESNDVRAIGICGMGGIGKTTTAKAFYNKYSHEFDISCFIENEKPHSQGDISLLPLLNRLLIELLRRKDYIVRNVESGIKKLKQIFSSKKALIVLDDLHQSIYSELLVRLHSLFFAGSRIIITTRDANLLNQSKVDISEVDIYMLMELDEICSLELFSYHAFRIPIPPESFRELAIRFVTYAGGVPLALKVLGSSLRGRTDVSFWKGKLGKLSKIPEKEIQKILQLSYDDLDDDTEKPMFLDIAFFFVGKDRDEAVCIFNSCDFFPDVGIPKLIERCLISIDNDNKFQMHNLLQCMGLELGKSTRMFLRGNARKDLQNLEGINKIEGLVLYRHTNYCRERQITAEILGNLSNLRLLEVGGHNIKGNFKNLFHQLRCIRWHGCPWEYLPSSFCPQKLVSLEMSSEKLRTLWKNPKQIKQLTDLSHLKLANCNKLKQLPEQLGDLKGLKMIDASDTLIEQLPDSIVGLVNLVELKLYGCWKLRKLPKQFGKLEGLRTFDASHALIEQLPDSFVGLVNLVELNLSYCTKLRKLPEQFGKLEGLRTFGATFSGIEQLPDSFACLINLVELELACCAKLTILPSRIWKLKSLKILNLARCLELERLPEQLGEMQCLEFLSASYTKINELPYSIGVMSRLITLNLNRCEKLKYQQDSIENLASLGKLQSLGLRCNIRLSLPMILSFSSLKKLSITDDGESVSSTIPLSLSKLYNLQYLELVDCRSIGSSLPQLPLNLKDLRLDNYATLEQLPDLSSFKQLKTLDIQRCISLQSIPPLPPQLEELSVEECTSLQDVADLSMSKELKYLSFSQCSNLKEVNLKESSLKGGQKLDIHLPFRAHLPNSNIAEWFRYQSNGCTISFDIPPNMGDDCVSVAFWVVYKVIFSLKREGKISAVITNKAQGLKMSYSTYVRSGIVGEVHSRVECIWRININELLKCGGRIGVLFRGGGNIKVKKCGIHVIQQTSSASW